MIYNQSQLLSNGKIILISTPQSGREGPLKLYSRLISGDLGIQWDRKEIWIITTNTLMNRIRLFHVDDSGFSLTVRMLFDKKAIKEGFRRASQGVRGLTRIELQELIYKGSIDIGSPVDMKGDIIRNQS